MEHRVDADKIKNGRDFVQAMESIRFVTPRNVDKLLSLLKRRNHMKAHGILSDYTKNSSYGEFLDIIVNYFYIAAHKTSNSGV